MLEEDDWQPLIEQLRAGGIEDWADFLRELTPQLRAYFARMGCTHHAAEDLTQEVLATVFCKIHRLREPSRFTAWVKSIARNRLRSQLRVVRTTERLDPGAGVMMPGGFEHIFGEDLRRLVQEELRRLAPHAQRLMELRLFEDLKPHEISDLLGVPCEVVRRRFHYAIKVLRRRVGRRIGVRVPDRR